MGLHVFPIPIPPPTSLSTRSLWVFPVHQARALGSYICDSSWINFCILCELKDQFVLCWYLGFLVRFVKKNVIFLWKYLGSIVENKLIVYMWIYLWSVFFDLPVCSSHMPHWLDYCSFSVNLEIRLYNYSILVHFQNCFVYSKSFVFLDNI